jgi:hypothetical protein
MSAACETVSGGRRFRAGFGGQAAIELVGLLLDKRNLSVTNTLLGLIVEFKVNSSVSLETGRG